MVYKNIVNSYTQWFILIILESWKELYLTFVFAWFLGKDLWLFTKYCIHPFCFCILFLICKLCMTVSTKIHTVKDEINSRLFNFLLTFAIVKYGKWQYKHSKTLFEKATKYKNSMLNKWLVLIRVKIDKCAYDSKYQNLSSILVCASANGNFVF